MLHGSLSRCLGGSFGGGGSEGIAFDFGLFEFDWGLELQFAVTVLHAARFIVKAFPCTKCQQIYLCILIGSGFPE